MDFANGRNFMPPLRLIGSGNSSRYLLIAEKPHLRSEPTRRWNPIYTKVAKVAKTGLRFLCIIREKNSGLLITGSLETAARAPRLQMEATTDFTG
jgi:hypothetical protein